MAQMTGLLREVGSAKLVVLVVALGLHSGPVFAQDQPPPDLPEYVSTADDGEIVLTPETAARWAVVRNTQVRVQQESVPEAEGQLQQAEAGDDLTVSVSASATRMGPVSSVTLPGGDGGDDAGGGGTDGGDEEPASFEVTPDQSYQATVSATKPLWTGGRTRIGEDLAREGIEAARWGIEVSRLSVAQAARTTGYGVLRSIQLAGVAAAQVTALAEHVRNAVAMEEAGVGPDFDVVQARTELAQAREQRISAQTGVEQVKAQLRQILTLAQDTAVQVQEAPPPEMPEGDLPELIDIAQANRPEMRTAETSLRMARLNRRLAGQENAPTVALSGQYTRQTAAGFTGDEYSWQISLMAEKPIFDGGVKRGKVTSADARVRQARLRVEDTREQIALEVVQAYLSVQEAEEKIQTAEQGLVEARERRRMAQLRYREGLAAGIEVIDADTALAAAEASLVNAQYDRHLAVTELRTAMGIVTAAQQEGETE